MSNQAIQVSTARTHEGAVHAEFIDLGSNEEVVVNVKKSATLRHAWNEAYKKLTEKHKPTDELLCQEGSKSLMSFLELNFEEMEHREICSVHKYKIRRETGGA
jgi:hypothetical protein